MCSLGWTRHRAWLCTFEVCKLFRLQIRSMFMTLSTHISSRFGWCSFAPTHIQKLENVRPILCSALFLFSLHLAWTLYFFRLLPVLFRMSLAKFSLFSFSHSSRVRHFRLFILFAMWRFCAHCRDRARENRVARQSSAKYLVARCSFVCLSESKLSCFRFALREVWGI